MKIILTFEKKYNIHSSVNSIKTLEHIPELVFLATFNVIRMNCIKHHITVYRKHNTDTDDEQYNAIELMIKRNMTIIYK